MNKYVKMSLFSILSFSAMIRYIPSVSAFNQTSSLIHFENYTTPNGIDNFGSGNASITIYPNQSQSLVGKTFNVCQLFYAENAVDAESINYTLNAKFAPALKAVVGERLNKTADSVTEYEIIDYIQTLNTHQVEGADTPQELEGAYSDYRYFLEDVRDEIKKLGIVGDTITVSQTQSDGSFTLSNLEFGYYLIDEITDNEQKHQACSLIMVNTANPQGTINIKSDYPEIIKKIHEDDQNIAWNDLADFEIGQIVPYKFESHISNMNGYDTYYYAWEDKMDDCLTFNKDSVKITISDGTKDYVLENTEFDILQNVENLTFKIEVSDIKAIVDREFNQMNDEKENIYGQSVRLDYNATLNDKAKDFTGRDGFENTVRLQFSNDPDRDGNGETGYTPWDTVVCFTYKINVSKVNNHNKVLANAKFRLYSDANCQNEVFVKATDSGYIVINRDSAGSTQPSVAVEMVSDNNGRFTIFGLGSGTYYLKETESPAGYRVIEDPIKIEINATFVEDRNHYLPGDGATDKALVNLAATANIKEFLNLTWKEQNQDLVTDTNDGAVNLTVINTVGIKLPQTGSSITLGLITLSVILAITAQRKAKKYNENA